MTQTNLPEPSQQGTATTQVAITQAAPAFSLETIEKMADMVVKGRLFPAVQTREAAVTLMLLCQAEGLHPMQALRRYDLIQNRPAMKTDAMLAEFIRRGGRVTWHTMTEAECEATFVSAGVPAGVKVRWTMEDAKRAGLGAKDNWHKYPRQMLRARVVSEGVRASDPGVNSGIYTPEEVQDFDTPAEKGIPARKLDPDKAVEVLSTTAHDAEGRTLGEVMDQAAVRRNEALAKHAPNEFRKKDQNALDEARARIAAREEAKSELFGGDDPPESSELTPDHFAEIERQVAEKIAKESGGKTKPETCTKRGCSSQVHEFTSTSAKHKGRKFWMCHYARQEQVRLLNSGVPAKEAAAVTTGHYREWAE